MPYGSRTAISLSVVMTTSAKEPQKRLHASMTPLTMSPSLQRLMSSAMTSESMLVWNTALPRMSSSRSSRALVRLPLCASAIRPHLPVNTTGCALSSELEPVVE